MATKCKATRRNAGGIDYTLTRKTVKNINLRVRPDGTVVVSANSGVSVGRIDSFVAGNAQRILAAQEKFRSVPQLAQPTSQSQRRKMSQEFLPIATAVSEEIQQKFQRYNIPMPEVRVRHMKSRWGSCYTTRGVIVLNVRLMDYPLDCIEFVVTHEFCHFVHPNHSAQFYALMDEMMPEWRLRRERLQGG